jgi:hypothetical protein
MRPVEPRRSDGRVAMDVWIGRPPKDRSIRQALRGLIQAQRKEREHTATHGSAITRQEARATRGGEQRNLRERRAAAQLHARPPAGPREQPAQAPQPARAYAALGKCGRGSRFRNRRCDDEGTRRRLRSTAERGNRTPPAPVATVSVPTWRKSLALLFQDSVYCLRRPYRPLGCKR